MTLGGKKKDHMKRSGKGRAMIANEGEKEKKRVNDSIAKRIST